MEVKQRSDSEEKLESGSDKVKGIRWRNTMMEQMEDSDDDNSNEDSDDALNKMMRTALPHLKEARKNW